LNDRLASLRGQPSSLRGVCLRDGRLLHDWAEQRVLHDAEVRCDLVDAPRVVEVPRALRDSRERVLGELYVPQSAPQAVVAGTVLRRRGLWFRHADLDPLAALPLVAVARQCRVAKTVQAVLRGTAFPLALSAEADQHSVAVPTDCDDVVARGLPTHLAGHTRDARDSTGPSTPQS